LKGATRAPARAKARQSDVTTTVTLDQLFHAEIAVLADVRRSSHYHQGFGSHQNSIPFCADVPSRYGCFTARILVITSAMAVSSAGASR
jgi:hypothetical protein